MQHPHCPHTDARKPPHPVCRFCQEKQGWTGSIMLAWKSATEELMPRARIAGLYLGFCACLLLGFGASPARAQSGISFAVRSASLQLVEGVYLLNARVHLPIDPRLRKILNDGVPLKLQL